MKKPVVKKSNPPKPMTTKKPAPKAASVPVMPKNGGKMKMQAKNQDTKGPKGEDTP